MKIIPPPKKCGKSYIDGINRKISRGDNAFWRLIREIIDFCALYGKNHISAYAAQSSLFIIISMVPFAMLFFTVLRAFIPYGDAALTEQILGFLPQKLQDFGKTVYSDINSGISVPSTAVTAIVLLWSAAKGIKNMRAGLKNIYGTFKPTDFITGIAFSLIYTLIFVVILIFSIAILIFGKQLNNLIFENVPIIRDFIQTILSFRNVLALLPLTLFFALSYKFLAKNDMKLSRHFTGALISALGWMLFSVAYAIYIDNFANYSYIYGSLTAIILLMLWLYACMNMFFIGAQINFWLYERNLTFTGLLKKIFKKNKN